MKILSIDPGYERVGIAVVEKAERTSKELLLFSDCFKTKAALPLFMRINLIGAEIERIINTYNPDALAIEKLYFNSNQKTAMGVAEARGVIIYVCTRAGMPIYEYTPLQIKVAVTGNGRADKKQLMAMLPHLIHLPKKIVYDDEYDAIATGLTCYAYISLPSDI